MKVALKVNKAWETIEPGQGDADKNDLARALLFQSIPESLIIQVGNLETSKELWEAVKARHVGADRVREARLQTLMDEFSRMKMRDTDTIDDFSGKLAKILSESSALGEDIEEFKLVKKFLNSLPRAKYIHIIVALEQVLNLNLTTFEDIVGRLNAYKERIQIEDQLRIMGNSCMLIWILNHNKKAMVEEILTPVLITIAEEEDVEVGLDTEEEDATTANVIGHKGEMHLE